MTPENNDSKNKLPEIISDNLLIATTPVIAYIISFFFEIAYLTTFDLPIFLAQVSIESFFFSLTVIISLFYIPYIIIEIMKTICPEKRKNDIDLAIPFIIFLFITILILYNTNDILHKISPILFLLLFTLDVYISRPLDETGKNYIERLRNSFKRTKETNHTRLLFSMFFILIISATTSGKMIAKETPNFLSTQIDNKHYALIRAYEDVSIFTSIEIQWINLYNYKEITGSKFLLLHNNNRNTNPYELKELNK